MSQLDISLYTISFRKLPFVTSMNDKGDEIKSENDELLLNKIV